VQAIIVAIDQYVEAATGNRDFFLNKSPGVRRGDAWRRSARAVATLRCPVFSRAEIRQCDRQVRFGPILLRKSATTDWGRCAFR
jgi:hypothetical protein